MKEEIQLLFRHLPHRAKTRYLRRSESREERQYIIYLQMYSSMTCQTLQNLIISIFIV